MFLTHRRALSVPTCPRVGYAEAGVPSGTASAQSTWRTCRSAPPAAGAVHGAYAAAMPCTCGLISISSSARKIEL